MKINGFSYDSKTGNIVANNRYIVRFERYCGDFYFYIKHNGEKRYLTQQELAKLRQSVIFFTENCGCDFGKAYEELIKQDYLEIGA